ncbi:plasmid replication protein RepC [Paracoccus sp. J56]|uniref:plasmid replication protein RepC n=1 Tax=Paracoccus sp. J56 TaxID=935850 RepID=UPI000A1C80FF|nr:plasmid replication protein RepC [Paracoccus sp. J56]
MGYIPITSFRRMVDAVQLQHLGQQGQPLPARPVDKWQVLRELAIARSRFGLSDRDITVLQALLSFHPGNELAAPEKLVVHPSNATICERLNGMPCSTMRRHLGNLVDAGVILRRDSPNGKRYVRRGPTGPHAFGFDLSPLVRRFAEISAAADEVRAEEQQLAALRETISLMRRDLRGLLDYIAAENLPSHADRFHDLLSLTGRALRRKLDCDELKQIETQLQQALDMLHDQLEPPAIVSPTEEMSSNDIENEQHYQNSNSESYESEKGENTCVTSAEQRRMPLGLVLSACQEIRGYSSEPIQHWTDFVKLAEKVRPMMGICSSAWDEAKRRMGAEEASVTLAAMLERFAAIRSPGAYLRSLSAKAAAGAFSSMPMVRALDRCLAA